MSEDDSETEKKKKKRLEGTGGVLGGGVLPEDDENRFKWSPTAVVTSLDIQCPKCNGHFSSNSAYRNHLPCRG